MVGVAIGAGFVYLLSKTTGILGEVTDAANNLQSAQASISSQITDAQGQMKKLAVANALSPGF